jgi:hypothetical protein
MRAEREGGPPPRDAGARRGLLPGPSSTASPISRAALAALRVRARDFTATFTATRRGLPRWRITGGKPFPPGPPRSGRIQKRPPAVGSLRGLAAPPATITIEAIPVERGLLYIPSLPVLRTDSSTTATA